MKGKFKLKAKKQAEQLEQTIDYASLKKSEILEIHPELDPTMTKKEMIKYLTNV